MSPESLVESNRPSFDIIQKRLQEGVSWSHKSARLVKRVEDIALRRSVAKQFDIQTDKDFFQLELGCDLPKRAEVDHAEKKGEHSNVVAEKLFEVMYLTTEMISFLSLSSFSQCSY